jgi:hypothetical protein
MTKLNWNKARRSNPDPGAVIEPPEDFEVDRWVPPKERERQIAKAAAARARLLKRSEELRFKAMIKKFGETKAIALGVPGSFVTALRQTKLENRARAKAAQERAEARKARRAARKAGPGSSPG